MEKKKPFILKKKVKNVVSHTIWPLTFKTIIGYRYTVGCLNTTEKTIRILTKTFLQG